MAIFSHHAVASTCTCSHVVGWSIAQTGTRRQKVEKQIQFVTDLKNQGYKLDFKLIIATITGSQINNSGGAIKELMDGIGWAEVKVGPLHSGVRENSTGALHLFSITPEEYQEGCEGYLARLKKELKELKSGPIDADELAQRQTKEELKLINLRRAGLVHVDSKVADVIITKLIRDESTLIAHIRMKYGIDFNEVWPAGDPKVPRFSARSFREMKDYHAAWRAGKVS